MAKRERFGLRSRRSRLESAPLDAPTVARAVEEGALISRLALTMATKNHIIVAALRDDHAFDADEVTRFVRTELSALALEQVSYARRMRGDIAELQSKKRKSGEQMARASEQLQLLTQRRVTYSALASELTRLCGEDSFVDEVVEAARVSAWHDVRSNVEHRLDRVSGSATEPDYAQKRAGRMMALRHIDLQALGRNTPGRVGPKLR